MGERTLTGILIPANRRRYLAVYSQWATDIPDLLAELRHEGRGTHQQDTAALAEAMIGRVARRHLVRGRLDEHPDVDLVQLTLLDPDHAGINVYANRLPRGQWDRLRGAHWALYSRHRLAESTDDLFTLTRRDTGTVWTCTHCGTTDQVKFSVRFRLGSEPAGPEGERSVATCGGCRSAEITDPHFTVTRTPPPAPEVTRHAD
ncbi:hypothetical protein AB0368_06730 [Actinoplanes sp. NPDC051475]|uniref:hypothetical protein n=1 Tax=Actinoplanes sp. NPDC051475 TaxID=3157225 RepID=UPI00344EE431